MLCSARWVVVMACDGVSANGGNRESPDERSESSDPPNEVSEVVGQQRERDGVYASETTDSSPTPFHGTPVGGERPALTVDVHRRAASVLAPPSTFGRDRSRGDTAPDLRTASVPAGLETSRWRCRPSSSTSWLYRSGSGRPGHLPIAGEA